MSVTLHPESKSRVKLSFEIPDADLAPFRDKALHEIAKEVTIHGFRKGHAPIDQVEERVGEDVIMKEAINMAVKHFYAEAVIEHKVQVVGSPEVEITSVAPLTFTAIAPVMPQVTLPDISHIKLTRKNAAATNEEYEKAMHALLKRAGTPKDVTDRPAQKGDIAEIDFTGYGEDNTEIPNTASKNHPLELGSNSFIPGFEDGVIGMQVGETKDISLTFPTEYHAKELAGTPIRFTVTLHKLTTTELPEKNDDLAKRFGSKEGSWTAFETELREFLSAEKKRTEEERLQGEFFEALIKEAKVELPDALVSDEVHALIHELEHEVTSQGMNFQDYLAQTGKSHQSLHEEYDASARARITLRLLLNALLEKEQITVSDEEFSKALEREMSSLPEADKEKARTAVTQDSQLGKTLLHRIRISKLIEVLLSRHAHTV